jgi:PilZ domain
MEPRSQFAAGFRSEFVEARRHPRYKLERDICVYPRNAAVVRGHTVDISESGISAMLRVEVPIGEVVRLEFSLAAGNIEVLATVRQRNAFRYGFQFVDPGAAADVIGKTCKQLAIEQSLRGEPTSSAMD